MKVNGLAAVGVLVVGLTLGFLAGRLSGPGSGDGAGSGSDTGGPAGKSSRNVGVTPGVRAGSRSVRRRSPAATIRQAARNLELSPMASMDFDAMFEIYDSVRWMTPEDVEVALGELEDAVSNPQIRMVMTMMLINHWAKQDGKGAIEYALTQDQPMVKSMGVMGGMMGWVKNDPEAAYAWYQENQEALSKGGMMAGQMDGMVLGALAQRDMKKAFEALRGLNRQSQVMALSVMGSQMTLDPVRRDEFIREIDTLDDADLRRQGMQGMMQMWAMQDPKGAVEYIDSREWEGDTGRQLKDSVAASWANMDAKSALEWRLEHLEDNESAADVVATSGFSQWMVQDPESAQEWLQAQPEELRSDQLYQQTASQLRWQNQYERAAEWALHIEDQAVRTSTLRDVYGAWNGTDPEAAGNWVKGLDAATQGEIAAPPADPANGTEVQPSVPFSREAPGN